MCACECLWGSEVVLDPLELALQLVVSHMI